MHEEAFSRLKPDKIKTYLLSRRNNSTDLIGELGNSDRN